MVDTSFQGTPEWYGGATGILKELIENQRKLSTEPFHKFTGERIAPFSPLQEGAFELAQRYSQPSPDFEGAREAIQESLRSNLQPYIQRATRAPTGEDIGQFMNPYQQQVVENIGRMGSRNLMENILPGVQNRFIRSGQYGSTGQQDLTNRAIRDTQEAVSQAQGQALQGGYNTALQAALGQQERQLQAGQLAGRDIERKLLGAEALQNLAGSQQTQGLRGVGALSQLGAQQQQQRQNAANVSMQEFQAEREHPYKQTQRLSEIVRGLPVNAQIYNQNIQPVAPQQPQASPYTQAGGLLMGASGAFRGFAKGGEVRKLSHHRHYADGGQVNPIQQGSNMAMDTAELKSMRDQAMRLQQPQGDPFGNALMRVGFGIAANRQPGVLAKLGEAGQMGLSEYQSGVANQEARHLESAKIMDMIQKTREIQANRAQKYEAQKQNFEQRERQNQAKLGLQRERLGMEKELYEKGIKGKGQKENKLFEKSNQNAIEEVRKTISSLPALKSNLKSLRELAEKLDTGATKGKIGKGSSTWGQIAGIGNAKDIDKFDALTNNLVLDLGNQLKGSQIALGKLKIIEQSKPSLTRVKGANIEIIDHLKSLADLSEEKSRFLSKQLKEGNNALDVENAFNQYADAKLTFEDKGEKFSKKPEEYLEGFEEGKELVSPTKKKDISKVSEEELDKKIEAARNVG